VKTAIIALLLLAGCAQGQDYLTMRTTGTHLNQLVDAFHPHGCETAAIFCYDTPAMALYNATIWNPSVIYAETPPGHYWDFVDAVQSNTPCQSGLGYKPDPKTHLCKFTLAVEFKSAMTCSPVRRKNGIQTITCWYKPEAAK